MAKKKVQPKMSSVVITMNGEVVLSVEIDNKRFKDFADGFMTGVSPFLAKVMQSNPPATHTHEGMTPEEIQELFKKYSGPEEK